MAKNKDDARAEGFKRGLTGKSSAAGVLQGWTDNKGSLNARNEGYMAGNRKRSQNEAEKKARDRNR